MLQAIKIVLITEILILATILYSFELFINLQVGVLSSFFIMLGSLYAYKKMVTKQLDSGNFEEQRDPLDRMEDPYELYTPEESSGQKEFSAAEIKQIVQEEKKKIKTFNFSSMKKGSKGSVSLFRLIPYIFLILGFIALRNNEMLDIAYYLGALFIGIVIGYISAKNLFALKIP